MDDPCFEIWWTSTLPRFFSSLNDASGQPPEREGCEDTGKLDFPLHIATTQTECCYLSAFLFAIRNGKGEFRANQDTRFRID
jgi:hypothetical protein